MRGLPFVVVCASISGLFATDAWAAAQAPCAPAAIRPSVASIPANLPAFGYTALKAKAENVQLFSTSGAKVEVPLTIGPVVDGYLKVAPASALTVGASYELTFDPFCSYGAYPAAGPLTFTVAPASPLPTKLGAVLALPKVTVTDFGTSKYTVTTSYAVAEEMKPWAAVYALGITVDGTPIETKITGPAADGSVQVVATGWCDAAAAAKSNHAIVLRARLPFATTLETTPSSLDFACPLPNIGTPKATGPTPYTPTTPPNGSSSNTGTNANGSPNGSSTSGGCSLAERVASRPRSSTPIIILAALAAACLLRRRSQRITTGEA